MAALTAHLNSNAAHADAEVPAAMARLRKRVAAKTAEVAALQARLPTEPLPVVARGENLRCRLCTYECASRGDFNKHVRVHRRLRAYACADARCVMRFTNSSNADAHRRRRHGGNNERKRAFWLLLALNYLSELAADETALRKLLPVDDVVLTDDEAEASDAPALVDDGEVLPCDCGACSEECVDRAIAKGALRWSRTWDGVEDLPSNSGEPPYDRRVVVTANLGGHVLDLCCRLVGTRHVFPVAFNRRPGKRQHVLQAVRGDEKRRRCWRFSDEPPGNFTAVSAINERLHTSACK